MKASFFSELKRRNVYKVAVAYGIAAWLLIPADGQDQPAAAAWIAARRDRIR